ncbi:TSCPD domain-containing protein [Geomonas subterranea]|uniref:ribonucleoside-diphosphate reductase n=1 Tax=Geomonas subterranea TaxID=2847989 RepID=A0ABX8LHU9_9BACT|nr:MULTISPECIES: TSCPD domain-containing protein [Geomonas]QXE89798.1 TSCPD domain-containing protein [Geomonas subterranea]QXM08084.1 TSCPD domain-containing protein [Geomonas subterranea]
MKKKARPGSLPSVTFQKETHCGRIYVTVTMDPKGKPFEIFVRFGKAGHCGAAVFDGLTRILSYALRSGLDAREAVKALGGIGCYYGKDTCMNAVSEALREVVELPGIAGSGHRGLRGPGAK